MELDLKGLFGLHVFSFTSGGYKEMSSIFADQKRPRNTIPNAGGGEGGGCRVSANEYTAVHIT
jgi:hypothetical protein